MDLAAVEDEIIPEERRMFGSLRQSRNTARMIQLFDPGNEAADRISRPARKRLSLNEDLFKKDIVVRKETLTRGHILKRNDFGRREALYSTENLKKTNSPKKEVQNKSHLFSGVTLRKKKSVERLSSVESEPFYDFNPSRNLSFDSDYAEDDDTDSERIGTTPQPASSHDTSDEQLDQAGEENLSTMVNEIENIRELLSGLKEKQSATRQLVDSYQSQDYSLSEIYERTEKLRRSKEAAISDLMNEGDQGPLLLQPSNLQHYETSFLDELNETDEYWDEFAYGDIIFGESTVL